MRAKKKQKSRKSSKTSKTSGKRMKVAFSNPRKNSKSSETITKDGRVIKRRMLYDHDLLQAAFEAVQDGNISVFAAAKQFGVPLTTLRDRVDGRISMNTTRPGPPLLMSKEEETQIVHFLQTMAKYGYRYTRTELGEIATDQAVVCGKRQPNANGLTTKWVDSFVSRWPRLKELSCKYKSKIKPEDTVRNYFEEIKKIIDKYKLLHKIFNIVEIPLKTDHSSMNSSLKSGHQFKTEYVTNTTVIACGSVSGLVMAPFFVYQASKLQPEMMARVPSNVNAAVSDTGESSPQIFRRFLNEHFLPQTQRFDNEPILVLMDGSKSHMFVGLSEWGKANNVIFSFIPAFTTHYLQPLQLVCVDNMLKKYSSLCKRHAARSGAGSGVSRNSIGELACQAYFKTFTRQALVQSFKQACVSPDGPVEEDGDDQSFSSSNKSNDSISENISYRAKDTDEEDDEEEETSMFSGDIVGQCQEVTEEELVTTTEVVLSADGQPQEVVVTPDGQLMFSSSYATDLGPQDRHFVIHDGNIFMAASPSHSTSLADIQPLHLVSTVMADGDDADLKPDLKSLSSPPLRLQDNLLASPTGMSEMKWATTVGRSLLYVDSDSSPDSGPTASSSKVAGPRREEGLGAARTMPLEALRRMKAKQKQTRIRL